MLRCSGPDGVILFTNVRAGALQVIATPPGTRQAVEPGQRQRGSRLRDARVRLSDAVNTTCGDECDGHRAHKAAVVWRYPQDEIENVVRRCPDGCAHRLLADVLAANRSNRLPTRLIARECHPMAERGTK